MKLFQRLRNSRILASAFHFIYFHMHRGADNIENPLQNEIMYFRSDVNSIRVAFICDEMTWQDYHGVCNGMFLHPKYWKEQLESFKPDFLFCESAWRGIDALNDVWRGRIYKDRRLLFENRDILIDILEYCKANDIPTAFWNKEDPTYFRHSIYDFTETAMMFDCIFTTAKECIPLYQVYGHNNVHLLPFGVSSSFCEQNVSEQIKGSAVFVGSWFGDQPQRCVDLEKVLDYAIEQGWKLDIFDRNYQGKGKKSKFPNKYKKYIHKSVPYNDIPTLCRKYEYAINVNTVTDSTTMFSRRLLQLTACGLKVVTNSTAALDSLNSFLNCQMLTDQIFLVYGNSQDICKSYSIDVQFDFVTHKVKKEPLLV